ncbi:Rrf2 family transcriptional regulator [Sphingorhabdus pulchriflava]|uniref:Rrf2 family transcriptional regulator n=1 Tax=Sphingorhabdus pulchriflava TaxID=2292257 RepID=A0A371BIZ1_9SPHN|nr:Rrf2 family transcriptional regulator [Sphingorhabdus pulchriflava]RDV07538.1 Rrf2 family transcriptional regulator [Sphingorhabdus pulchriflava]
MRLNLHTDYALRILMYLASKGGQASVDEIAGAYGISRNHLMKVARSLVELQLIEARRGRGGGFALAASADAINVGYVVRRLESLEGFVECFDRTSNSCPVAGACGLQGALNGAVAAFLDKLDEYRLSDLLPDRNRFLRQLKAFDQAPNNPKTSPMAA